MGTIMPTPATAFMWAMAALLIAVGLNAAQLMIAVWILGRAEKREIERDVRKVVEAADANHG